MSKIFLTFLFSLSTLFVPYYSLKIALGIIAIVLLGLTFRRFGVTFIVLAIIFVVLPLGIIGIMNSNFFFMPRVMAHVFPFEQMFGGYRAHYRENHFGSQKIYPDKSIEGNSNVILNVNGLELTFDPNSTEIKIPSELNVERFGDNLEISLKRRSFNNITYVVKIGTKRAYNSLKIQSNGLTINGEIGQRIGLLSVGCNGISLNGILNVNALVLNCNGAVFDGEINAKSVRIGANGVVSHLSIENVQNFSMSCNGIMGDVTYKDAWNGTRTFHVNGTSGSLTIRIPESAGELNVNADRIHVNKVRY